MSLWLTPLEGYRTHDERGVLEAARRGDRILGPDLERLTLAPTIGRIVLRFPRPEQVW